MPDANGRLTPEDIQKVAAWWQQHWKAPVVCPVCKTSEWSTAAHVVNVPRHAADAYAPNAVTYPQIAVGCNACGHTMFFNAVKMGITPMFAEAPPPGTPSPPAQPMRFEELFNQLFQKKTG